MALWPRKKQRKSDAGQPDEGTFFKRNEGHSHEKRPRGIPRGIIWGILGLLAVFVGGFAVTFFIAKGEIATTLEARTKALMPASWISKTSTRLARRNNSRL